MKEYKSRLSAYLTGLVREELEKYDGGYTDEWNDQRKKNAEVLGYKLQGTSDISEGVKDPKLKVGQKIRYKNDSRRLYTLKKITHGNRGIPEDPAGTSYMFVAPGNRKEYHTKKTWAQAIKKGWIILESIDEKISKEEWSQYPAYARKLKPYMQRLLKVRLKVRVIKQANHNPWIEIRVARFGKDIIPNDFRKKAFKVIGGRNARDMDNINYGNIRTNSISMKHDQWVKLLGNKVKESVIKEGGMGILDTDQADVLQAIVMRNKNKSTKSILSVALKSGHFKGVDKKELLGYIDGARQFVKYMKSHPVNFESINEALHPYKDFNQQDHEKQYDLNLGAFIDKYQQMMKFMKKYKEVPDKNKRTWAALIRKKVGQGRFNGLIGDWSQVTQYLKSFDKFRNKKDDYAWDIKGESTKRDYKAEYKKFQSSTKSKKYRAELNQYNRKKGTYGNGDGKDASHKGGKIAGFEKESTNRGRREKSRLKKEDIREFSGDAGINVYLGGILQSMKKAGLKPKTAKVMKHGFSKSRDKIGFFIEVEQRGFDKKEMYTLQVEIDRDGNLWYLSGHRDMKLGKWADTSKIVRMWKALDKVRGYGQDALFKRR